MSTGISMSSVNKIKELADNGDYSLALDILEHQDLSKSLSPQFVRICGEVYYENQRYSEARASLVRAHAMAPAGNKIIFSIIKLYLTMGLWELAGKYFEIYKFNQNGNDAGTYRIEYMMAKAYRKPVKELYSILLNANDAGTDETWDFEMLLLHAYIRNRERYENACVEFKAKYKSSPHLYMLDTLMDDQEKLESMIYCYPESEAADDIEEQAGTREYEKSVLVEDDLRLHPKDAKITIMVEDDAPVTNTMRFKQMWIRSKDKKERKKADKELEDSEDEEKKPKGIFGIFARKEEQLAKESIDELAKENPDREELLEEVLSPDGSLQDMPDVEPQRENPDMVELKSELKPEDTARYNSEDEADTEEDSFVIEEEPEEVIMVDFDDDGDETWPPEEETVKEPETFLDEFDTDGFEESGDEAVEVLPETWDETDEVKEQEEVPEADEVNYEAEEAPEADEVNDESEETPEADEVKDEPEEAPEADEVNEEPEEAPEADEIKEEPETDETADVPAEDFDFDRAFDELGELEVDEYIDVSEFETDDETAGMPNDAGYGAFDEDLKEKEDKAARGGFPVFTSSLFPDYNTEGGGLYDLHENPEALVSEEEEEKISENLKKEEELIGETDRLLARLGIKLGTEFNSILDFDDDDSEAVTEISATEQEQPEKKSTGGGGGFRLKK